MVVPGMIRRGKKVEADMPEKSLFLCSFINLLVLECPVGDGGGGGGGGGRGWGGGGGGEDTLLSEILFICLANTF